MRTINLSNFQDYNSNSLYQFLLQQNLTEFKRLAEKYHSINAAEDQYLNISLATDYYHMSYVGQSLFDISETFAYYIPDPYADEPFIFEITISNMDILADYLI